MLKLDKACKLFIAYPSQFWKMILSRQFFVRSARLGGIRSTSSLRHNGTVIRQHMTYKMPLFNNLVFIRPACRQTCYVASQPEILKCESSKELLSVGVQKTLDWNFDPRDLVCIFNSLVDIVYKEVKNVQTIQWVHEDKHIAFKQLRQSDMVESVLWSRIEGLELEQLLGSLQSYVHVLDSESLSAVFESLLLLGISLENPAVTALFIRLFDKNMSFTWTDFQNLNTLYKIMPNQRLFKSQYLMPKFIWLINSGGLDGRSRQMILSLMQFIRIARDIIKPGIFSKCIKKTSSYILEDEIFQEWEVLSSVLKCIAVISLRNYEFMTDDVFRTIREISRKAMESVQQHVGNIPISKYSDIIMYCLTVNRNILAEPGLQLHTFPFFEDMIETCLKQLERDDLSIIDLCYIAMPVLIMQKNFEAKLKCWKMIIDNLKHADSWIVTELMDVYNHYYISYGDCRMPEIVKSKMRRELVLQFVRNIDHVLINGFPGKAFLSFCKIINSKARMIDSELNLKSFILTKAITAFKRQSYETRSTIIIGSLIITCSDVRYLPDTVVDKILAVIPQTEPSILSYLADAFSRVNTTDKHPSRRFFQIFEICHNEMVKTYKEWLAKKPSLPKAVLIICNIYYRRHSYDGRRKHLRSDEESPEITYFQSLLPVLACNVTIADFFFSIKTIHYTYWWNHYDELFLDIITDFCVRNSADMTFSSLSCVLSYMDRVGYHLKNEEFECLCKDLIDRKFDNMTIEEQIESVWCMCNMQIYPEKQIMKIFTLEYLQVVDRFLQERHDSRKGLRRLMKMLSLLNTILVIDCPQFNIPWIMHSRYTELECPLLVEKYPYEKFLDEVDVYLFDVVRGASFYGKNVVLPYSYRGAFVVYMDKSGNIVMYEGKKINDQSVQRVVFLLHPRDMYCFGSRKLLGTMERKVRHLQMLGNKVVEIPYYEWNSMYLSTPKSKREYISEKLFL